MTVSARHGSRLLWPRTTWYGWREGDRLTQLALLYAQPGETPTVAARAEEPHAEMRDFLAALLPRLPRAFYAHLPPSHLGVLEPAYRVGSHWLLTSMALPDAARLPDVDAGEVVRLYEADRAELAVLYAARVEPAVLAAGRYLGVRRDGRLASVAGLHVYSPAYGVAVLGNVYTDPVYRRRGLSLATCAQLCCDLRAEGIAHIGLNVTSDNTPAIACYERLGFVRVDEIGAYELTTRGTL